MMQAIKINKNVDICNINKLKESAKTVPPYPGVYIMKDADGVVIYIGKAKVLPNRLLSYFQNIESHTAKTFKMLSKIGNFEYIVTSSEYEALVLECSLIKIHRPKYNILLKDSKGYHYIKATNENWRRLRLVSKKDDENARYFGPYISYFNARRLLEETCGIFKIAVCNRDFNINIKIGPCLNFHINRCSAPCGQKISKEEYDNNFENALDFIKNGNKNILKKLKNDMIKAASEMKFEQAAKIRDTIFAIEKTRDKQTVVSGKVKEQDVIAFFDNEENLDKNKIDLNLVGVEIFKFHEGNLFAAENFSFEKSENLSALRSEFIKMYYSHQSAAPPRITLDGRLNDRDLIEKWLCEKFNKKIKISIPKKGEQLKLILLCGQNAKNAILNFEEDIKKVLEELAAILNLKNTPKYIESYDISNINGKENAGAMVVFKDGVPFKRAYRKFKIKKEIIDDYSSMAEMLTRRAKWHLFSDKTDFLQNFPENGPNDCLPDLILIDGGMAHAKIASETLHKFGFYVPVFGMVKNDKHQTRALTTCDKILEIKHNDKVFRFISEIQNETHRFAISYHKKLRNKKMFNNC